MMSNKIHKTTIILILIAFFISCKKDAKRMEAEKIVAEWTGKEIIIPNGIQCNYLGKDTICPNIDRPYKILLYTDSTGCTSCKLHLYKWNTIIEEADSLMPGQVSFHFYFQPKNEKELGFMLRRDNFKQTVYIDTQNKLYEANRFPDNISYQCFLLDKDNKVIAIGNPTLNPKIWDIYKEIIIGSDYDEQNEETVTSVKIEQTEIELENTKIHESSTAIFVLKNTGNVPLLIKDVSASCGCTVPRWDRKPIKPGDITEIKVKVTPDGAGYLRKTVTVFCNTEKRAIPLTIKSMVKG